MISQFIRDPQGDELSVSSGEILPAVIEKRMACHGKVVHRGYVAAKVRSEKKAGETGAVLGGLIIRVNKKAGSAGSIGRTPLEGRKRYYYRLL